MLGAIEAPVSPRRAGGVHFHSRFGGLWIDRTDAARVLKERALAPELEARVRAFMDDGYVVIPGAVDPTLADRLVAQIDISYTKGDERLRYHTDGSEHRILKAGTDPQGKRLVEAHAVLGDVRAALGSAAITAFLRCVFEEQPVLTQTLIFNNGSEQAFHQDPVFVAFDQPMKMAAAWIALEDITPGSGELQYLVGSHRLPDYVFSTGKCASQGALPGEVDTFGEWLLAQATLQNLPRKTFLARKGDVLIWHAGLAHGGSPITAPGATRKSLVGHFCPTSVLPIYPNAKVRRQDGAILYSSYLYDVGST